MKLSQAKIALLLLVLILPSTFAGCVLVNRIRAKNSMNEGARAFRDGRFLEAEQKFREAYALDPEQKNTTYLIARSVHEQYKPGVDTPENKGKAEEAIKAYEVVLNTPEADQKAKDSAYEAIVYLFNMLGQEDRADEWLRGRAENASVPPEKRADAYTVLASKKAKCSNDITEQEGNKKQHPTSVEYVMPANQADFTTASQCADDGLKLIQEATENLNPNSAEAWKVKRDLLLEKAKLAMMQKNAAENTRYIAEAADAHAEFERLDALAKQKRAEEEAKKEKEKS